MSKKLTNEIIDQRLMGGKIARVDDYCGAKEKIQFRCLECEFIWKALSDNILSGKSHCPKCSGGVLFDNEDIDKKLLGKDIVRIEDYKSSRTKIQFRCLKDDFIWSTLPYNVVVGGTGCPKCSDRVGIDNDLLNQRLAGRNIIRLDDCKNGIVKIRFQCEIDNFVWEAVPNSVMLGTGCPKCSNHLPLTNEMIDRKLDGRNILRLDDCKGSLSKIRFQCLQDNFIWEATPNNVVNNLTGCPNCSIGKNEKIINAIFTQNGLVFERHKNIRNIIVSERRNILVDFYLKDKNIIVEFNGEQHYRPVRFGGIAIETANDKLKKQQERDAYLQNLCDEHSVRLIWIDGRKFTNQKLKKMVSSLIGELK